jgi:hypothetical protein
MERFAPQLRAEAGSAFVYPNDRSSAIQIEAARRSFPYLEVIGDFHSHVWPSHREMMVETGWTWSGHDERDIPRFVSEMQKYGWNPRILLIAGISPRAKRVNPGYLGSGNVFRETLGPAHIVLSAHRIKTDHTLTDT